jgi:hypothetical protein
MGGVSPKTFWASYKYGKIKFWYIVAFVWFFFTKCNIMHGCTNIKFSKHSLTCSTGFKNAWNCYLYFCILLSGAVRNLARENKTSFVPHFLWLRSVVSTARYLSHWMSLSPHVSLRVSTFFGSPLALRFMIGE